MITIIDDLVMSKKKVQKEGELNIDFNYLHMTCIWVYPVLIHTSTQ